MNNTIPTFPVDEYIALLGKLDSRHAVFYRLWEMGKPEFTLTDTNTAGVIFDTEGKMLKFIINYDFWQSQTENQKLFVLCHECLHIILQHGVRFFIDRPTDFLLRNYATDISINHMLVNKMGFSREEIDPQNVYCWVDKFFEEATSEKESVEWYYNRLKNIDGADAMGGLVDDHSISDNHPQQDFSSVIQDLDNTLTPEEKALIKDLLDLDTPDKNEETGGRAGSDKDSSWTFVDTTKVVEKKKKWETVIKKWAIKYMKESDKEETQWARINRRFTSLSSGMFLPSEMEITEKDKVEERIQVWFFQDTSGSCYGYTERFFDAARSLPEERFDVKMHCFDTYVYETTLESGRLYGFGGTSFSCIEEYIRWYVKIAKCDYPKAVFVITDGYGDYVVPQKPEVWHWFLTPRGSKYCIPDESNIFDLGDFE